MALVYMQCTLCFFFLPLVHDLSAGPSGRVPAEIVGSNPTGDMDVCLL
jgi:hypothetical protein